MKDCFDAVHELLRAEQYNQVLRLLLNPQLNKIEPPYDSDLNHAWYLVGNIFTDMENYKGAVSAFKKSLEDWPEDDQAMSALAYCYMEIDKPLLAQKQLEKAIQIKPKEEYYYNLGNAFFDQCKYEKAIELYKTVGESNDEVKELAQKNIKKAKALLKKR